MSAPIVVTAIAALATAAIAWRGLSVWKHQLRAKDGYELARRYLRAVYDVRVGFKGVRNPLILAGEMQDALAESGNEQSRGYALSEAGEVAVYDGRWKVLADAWATANEAGLDGEVLWNKARSDILGELRSLIGELRTSLHRMIHERRQRNPDMEALQIGLRRLFTSKSQMMTFKSG